jgi:hypothetical protein
MRSIIIIFLVLLITQISLSQGCSDAGLCTVTGLDSGSEKNPEDVTFRFSTVFGLGEQNVFHTSVQLEAIIPVIESQSIQVKIPYNSTFGNLGNVSGLGDLTLTINQNLFSGIKTGVNVIAGVKIPSSDANKTLNGYSLPMAYQPSLGTYDIIFGISSTFNKWHLGIGYQHSFGNNLNEFQHSNGNPVNFNNYNESYHLKRADDIMLRLERSILIKEAKILLGALPIYHLGDDKIRNGEEVAKSSGLTLNLVSKLVSKLGKNWFLEALLAAPIIDKEARPDGLTRSFVASVSIYKKL